MELKFYKSYPTRIKYVSYNWTLLELKFIDYGGVRFLELVIIEPYWNWNAGLQALVAWGVCRYNWTLLELKSVIFVSMYYAFFSVIIEPYWNWNNILKHEGNTAYWRYNWTLLELKWGGEKSSPWIAEVIIEPYWNWNFVTAGSTNRKLVIIEPYWNWNAWRAPKRLKTWLRYNWTLLELKFNKQRWRMNITQRYNWTLLELKYWSNTH